VFDVYLTQNPVWVAGRNEGFGEAEVERIMLVGGADEHFGVRCGQQNVWFNIVFTAYLHEVAVQVIVPSEGDKRLAM
jgi:hypothetical protein